MKQVAPAGACLIHITTPLRSWLRLVGDASPRSRDREGAVDQQERDDGLALRGTHRGLVPLWEILFKRLLIRKILKVSDNFSK